MKQRFRFRTIVAGALVGLFLLSTLPLPASAWSNGSPSTSTSSPKYSTHDWIAQHALDWLPDTEKGFITSNLNTYLYGTELPDFQDAVGGDGIGDTYNHHVYYRSDGSLQDDAGAARAQDLFNAALNDMRHGDYASASKWAGAMAHYIGDLAAFGHLMGASTDWGTETHHSDYEDYMRDQTAGYSTSWDTSLIYDGTLANISARDAALEVAYDTTFDESGQGRTAAWMDQHYGWGDSDFRMRVGQSLSISVNAIADALHTLWVEAGKSTKGGGTQPFIDPMNLLSATIVVVTILVLIISSKVGKSKKRRHR